MSNVLTLRAYFLLSRWAQYSLSGERPKRSGNGRYSPQERTIARLMTELQETRQGVLKMLSQEEDLLKANPGALVYRKFD